MNNIVVGLDIGTCFVRAVMGQVGDSAADGDKVKIISVAKQPSSGFLRNGTIVNIEATKQCIHEVIDEIEQNSGLEVSSCVTGIGGVQIESLNSTGAVAISSYNGDDRAITQDDVRRVIECANSVKIPLDRKLLHVIPQQYIIDNDSHFKNPINSFAHRLEVDVHIITASRTTVQNVTTCIDQTGCQLDEVMLKTLACTEATLFDDEKKLGSILIDIGGGTTDVVVIVDDAPICTCSIPIGGNLVTNDIAIVKGIPSAVAEKIKIESGCCWLPFLEEHNSDVIIPGFGCRSSELTDKVELCQIIYPRMEEIFTMVRDEIAQKVPSMPLSGGIVLTGGGAQLCGAVEMAKSVFNTSSVRVGYPKPAVEIEENYRTSEYATAVGLILAHKNHGGAEQKKMRRHSSGSKKNGESMLQKVFRKFF